MKQEHLSSQPRSKSLFLRRVKSYFDANEFERVIDIIEPSSILEKEIASMWLLSGILCLQKSRQDSTRFQFTSASSTSKSKTSQAINKDNASVDWARFEEHAASLHSKFSNDSIICFLYALLLRLRESSSPGGFDHVQDLLVTAIKLNQYNWAAWLELSCLSIPAHIDDQLKLMELYQYYSIEKSTREKSSLNETLATLRNLRNQFPDWNYISVKLGTLLHDQREFKESATIFAASRNRDKFSIAGMDVYSNCLYVNEQLSDLSDLAHFWISTNPNACETNVIAGNYFSLKSDHEKASLFFKRATVIDPKNTNAWLLLGHELIELRNPSAALAAYKSAIESDSNDPRCWYSIGQLFELINQHAFAVYYHNKALEIDATDSRILRALSSCYEKLGRSDEASKCDKKVSEFIKGL